MADNYAIQLEQARRLFLTCDQTAMIRRLGLEQDGDSIFVDFLHRRWRISRREGRVYDAATGEAAGFRVCMSIYDYLGRTSPAPVFSGRKCTVNSLGRHIHPGVDESSLFSRYAPVFDREFDSFCGVCLKMGARPFPIGDAAFVFTVFPGLEAALQLWRADDEFPAGLILLWDENTLDALRYETLWFIARELLEQIEGKMGQIGGRSQFLHKLL